MPKLPYYRRFCNPSKALAEFNKRLNTIKDMSNSTSQVDILVKEIRLGTRDESQRSLRGTFVRACSHAAWTFPFVETSNVVQKLSDYISHGCSSMLITGALRINIVFSAHVETSHILTIANIGG